MTTPPATEAFPRISGAEIWSTLSRQEQADVGAIVVELVAARRLEQRVYEDQLDFVVGRAADAALRLLNYMLDAAVGEAFVDGALEAEDGVTPRIPSLLGGVCRTCGCTQDDACPGGCGWAGPDLCTACADDGTAAADPHPLAAGA
ncbi:hypothetical protein [Methylobacterium sp. JK268]